MICRVRATSYSALLLKEAVTCHYFSRASFLARQASEKEEDLPLGKDDLLLIGSGLRENPNCNYGMADFMKDRVLDISKMGTRESLWKTESRSLTVGSSKYLGITMSGNQKLIPRTTLKQLILDKWSTNASRSNPGVFNQYLGVEISHCTGNARRVPLRKLMTIPSVWILLERQVPGWMTTPWGQSLETTLQAKDTEAIFHVWKDFAPDRTKIGELLCCLLELLDCTGWQDHNFNVGLLYNNEESAVCMNHKGEDSNDWSKFLRDTPLTCAYVIINEQCLNCEVPNLSTSSCHIEHAYTVLETDFAVDNSTNPNGSFYYRIRPVKRRLNWIDRIEQDESLLSLIDCGSTDIAMLGFVTGFTYKFTTLLKSRALVEIYNPVDCWTRSVVFVRASKRSFHGKRTPKQPKAHSLFNPPAVENRMSPRQDIQHSAKANHYIAQQAIETAKKHRSGQLPDQLHGPEGDMTVPTQMSGTPGPAIFFSQTRKDPGLEEDTEKEMFRTPDPRTRTNQLQTADTSAMDCEDLIHSDVYGQDIYAHLPDSNRRLGHLRG